MKAEEWIAAIEQDAYELLAQRNLVLEDEKARLAEQLERAERFSGAALTLQNDRTGRIYVAGPMTGIEDYNFAAFNEAAERLRHQGWHVENPADHVVVEGAEWQDYLRYDIARLATCSTLFMLSGWEKSKGARLEKSIADALGMSVIYASSEASLGMEKESA